jgi:hypothetical protein
MAVMLNTTDAADGFPFTPHYLFTFSPYNQTLALSVYTGLVRHVSCEIPSEDSMTTVVLSAEIERFISKETNHGKAKNRIQRVEKNWRQWNLSAYLYWGV